MTGATKQPEITIYYYYQNYYNNYSSSSSYYYYYRRRHHHHHHTTPPSPLGPQEGLRIQSDIECLRQLQVLIRQEQHLAICTMSLTPGRCDEGVVRADAHDDVSTRRLQLFVLLNVARQVRLAAARLVVVAVVVVVVVVVDQKTNGMKMRDRRM